jgi:hypothetical protein
VREVRYFIIGGRGDGIILPGRNGQEGALFFFFFFYRWW